jgi:hypothetical protein
MLATLNARRSIHGVPEDGDIISLSLSQAGIHDLSNMRAVGPKASLSRL